MVVLALLCALLLVFLLLQLLSVSFPVSSHCLMLTRLAHLWTSHLCTMPLQAVGVQTGSHGQEGYHRWVFQSDRRFASCLRGGGRSEFSVGSDGDQDQAPGGPSVVW